MTDDEKFFAWLDGELSGADAAEMETRVAADPRLQQLAEQHRAMQEHLRHAFDRVALEPVPERLMAALKRPDPEILNFADARRIRRARWLSPMPLQWAAIAATLAVGILVGAQIPRGDEGHVEMHGSSFYAAAALGRVLETGFASAPSGNIRIGITFRDRSGAICRSFTEPAASGLACRDQGRWQMRGLFASPEARSSDYRMAAGMDPNLAALIGSTISGTPFNGAQERAAQQRGWR